MFTGIVLAMGDVRQVNPRDGDVEIVFGAGGLDLAATGVGDSVCVNGVCLTATRVAADAFAADVSRETLDCTTLGLLAPGVAVNLEPALRAGQPLGGHYVTGHVDAVARVLSVREEARSRRLVFATPTGLARYIASKGSVTLDGVSLTVNEVGEDSFGVNLVPHTLQATTLGALEAGARVNLEVDVIARYVERLAARPD